ncbi:hypothetical protein PSTG_17911 [Puccinia striiformis f. sp. tritici PST-78]|uniref:Uncharacterized protein n=1 Tax=Puccinia striiformis f. sp. tritici PST-78 TaxID=1165861 RepID=A0A0L0UNY0_9BASI|nr:hypothetical protein PSTG_17911 [Puccinia striiformis f. sp. tritici PST-78]
MPWLRDHGQRVDWEKGLVRDSNPSRPATKQEERTGALSEGGRRTETTSGGEDHCAGDPSTTPSVSKRNAC